MLSRAIVVLALLAFATSLAQAQPAPPASDAAQAMVGAWEISNADRDRSCAITFSVDRAPGGLKLELDTTCATAIPLLGDVVAWKVGPNDVVLLLDAKGATVVEFTEVESGLYESDRRVGGLMFLQAQAAIKAQTRTADQLFGDWQFLRELDKPLCKLTLSSDGAGGDSYRLVVKPGCEAGIAGLGFTTWRLDRDQIVLVGPGATWRFAESDPTTWERFPLTEDPLLLVRP